MIKLLDEISFDYEMPILGKKEYLLTKSDTYGWFKDDDYVIAFFIDKHMIFKRLVFTTEVVGAKKNISIEEEKLFLNKIINYIQEYKICDFVYKAQSNVVLKSCPKNSICVPWGTYEVNLECTEEELFNSFNQKSRNVIRKAIKSKVLVEQCQDIKDVYDNIKATLIRQKSIHYPSLSYLEKLNQMKTNVAFFVVKKSNIIQGSLVLLFDENKGYAMYAGSLQKPTTGSIDLLHFEAMKFLKTKNIKIYDFVGTRINIPKGSKQEGIDKFKRKFNPSLRTGYAFMTIINPIKYQLFTLLSKIYLFFKGYKYMDPILKIKSEELNNINKV